MPHLSNCDHQENGWCLACVRKLWEEKEQLDIENIGFGYAIQTLRRKCGLSNDDNSTDCMEIWQYIDMMQTNPGDLTHEGRNAKLMLALQTLAESVQGESYLPPRLVESALLLEKLGKCKVRRMAEGWTIQSA